MTQIDVEAFAKFEASGWEERAAAYDAFFAPITSRSVEPLLDAAGVVEGTRLLDVATGPGYVARAAAKRGAEVVGVDVAEAMVELARRSNPGVEFLRGDAEQLPVAEGEFDAVVANFLMLHLGRPERAAAEFARALGAGGRVAVSVWNFPDRTRLFGIVLDAVSRAGVEAPVGVPAGPDIFRFSDDDEFRRLLEDAGFEDVGVSTLDFTHALADADEFWDGMVGGTVRTRALVIGQDADAQRRIRCEVEALLAEYRVGETFEVPVSVKIAAGRRT